MTALSDLIRRLEAATEGSRELDALVWVATLPRDGVGFDGYSCAEGWHYEYDAEEDGKVNLYVVLGNKTSQRRAKRPAPHYTTSIDAALTLVPEGWWLHNLGKHNEDSPCEAVLWQRANLGEKIKSGRSRQSIALALCIAALKAHEAQS